MLNHIIIFIILKKIQRLYLSRAVISKVNLLSIESVIFLQNITSGNNLGHLYPFILYDFAAKGDSIPNKRITQLTYFV